MSDKTIAVPDEIYERVQEIATAEGTTVEELLRRLSSGISRVAGLSG